MCRQVPASEPVLVRSGALSNRPVLFRSVTALCSWSESRAVHPAAAPDAFTQTLTSKSPKTAFRSNEKKCLAYTQTRKIIRGGPANLAEPFARGWRAHRGRRVPAAAPKMEYQGPTRNPGGLSLKRLMSKAPQNRRILDALRPLPGQIATPADPLPGGDEPPSEPPPGETGATDGADVKLPMQHSREGSLVAKSPATGSPAKALNPDPRIRSYRPRRSISNPEVLTHSSRAASRPARPNAGGRGRDSGRALAGVSARDATNKRLGAHGLEQRGRKPGPEPPRGGAPALGRGPRRCSRLG